MFNTFNKNPIKTVKTGNPCKMIFLNMPELIWFVLPILSLFQPLYILVPSITLIIVILGEDGDYTVITQAKWRHLWLAFFLIVIFKGVQCDVERTWFLTVYFKS